MGINKGPWKDLDPDKKKELKDYTDGNLGKMFDTCDSVEGSLKEASSLIDKEEEANAEEFRVERSVIESHFSMIEQMRKIFNMVEKSQTQDVKNSEVHGLIDDLRVIIERCGNRHDQLREIATRGMKIFEARHDIYDSLKKEEEFLGEVIFEGLACYKKPDET